MIEPMSASTGITGLRMIWTGIQWILRSRQAPWSVVPMSATIEPYILPWYSVRFFCSNERPFAVELLQARTIRPKGRLLCKPDPNVQIGHAPNTEAAVQDDLKWLVQEKGASNMPFQRYLFVNLSGMKGDVAVDFELKARFIDNRRSEVPIWVRTNPIKITG